jgi:hypothetical protein
MAETVDDTLVEQDTVCRDEVFDQRRIGIQERYCHIRTISPASSALLGSFVP